MTDTRAINVMTIDVEDYFQVSNFEPVVTRESWSTRESRVAANTDKLLALFAEADLTATFFVLAWVAEHHPRVVRRIAAAGHEIASHGYSHRLVYEQSTEEFRDDIRRARRLLEDLTGSAVAGYRAPSFSITRRSLWALEVLVEEGYCYDSSIYPIRHDRYGIPGSPRFPYRIETPAGAIIEAPGSTARVGRATLPIGGGGYFRLLPYRWTAWGIGQVNRQEQASTVFFLHPWEVDPEQPRLPAAWHRRVRHYGNLAATETRLERLLREFRFGPMAPWLAALDASGELPTLSPVGAAIASGSPSHPQVSSAAASTR